jgi:uncharacterized membrane protein
MMSLQEKNPMAFENKKPSEFWLTTTRLESLVDNIFAFAMTIMVLDIVSPRVTDNFTPASLAKALVDLWPHISSFVVSFIILAIFWVKHHKMFAYIERVDRPLLWINIFIAMGIVLLPFSTQFSAKFDGKQLAEMAFDLNLLILGLLYYLNWTYATWNHRLVEKSITLRMIRHFKGRLLILPAFCIAAMVLSFIHPSLSSLIYIVIPLLLFNFLF